MLLGAESSSRGSGCLAVLMQAARGEPHLGRPAGFYAVRNRPPIFLDHPTPRCRPLTRPGGR